MREDLTYKVLKDGGKKHKVYNHYKKREYLLNYIEENYLYLTDGYNWDDVKDRGNLNNDDSNVKRYAMCFGVGYNENIANWLINAKIKDNKKGENPGILLRLSNSVMKSILNDITKVEIGKYSKDYKKFDVIKELDIKKDKVSIYLADIYYVNNKTVKNINKGIKDECIATIGEKHYNLKNCVFERTKHLSKAFGWKFENECRLIVEVNKDILKKLDTNNSYARIKLSDDIKKRIKSNQLIEDPINGMCEYRPSDLLDMIDYDKK